MTRKHFEAIAKVIAEHQEKTDDFVSFVYVLADELAKLNSGFNYDKFIKAALGL